MGRPIGPCENTDPIVRSLHKLLLSSGMEIQDVTERSGIGHDTMRMWFRRGRKPNIVNMSAVLKVLGHKLVVSEIK